MPQPVVPQPVVPRPVVPTGTAIDEVSDTSFTL